MLHNKEKCVKLKSAKIYVKKSEGNNNYYAFADPLS